MTNLRILTVLLIVACGCAPAFGQSAGTDLQDLAPATGTPAERLHMSNADDVPDHSKAGPEDGARDSERWFTLNKAHQYMGIGSLVLVGAAVLASPGEDEGGGGEGDSGGLHHNLAVAATALGAGAVATGLLFHWDDLDFSHPFRDPDTLHALFGSLGELGFVLAVNAAPAGGHAGAGVLGALSMALAIKLAW
jgi:hypothetical protein